MKIVFILSGNLILSILSLSTILIICIEPLTHTPAMSTSAPALNYYKLETEFHDGYVLHRTYEWQYSVRHETSVVKWTRGKTLGKGSSGVVWREEESGGEIRAVKCLERRSSHLMDAGVTRELLALITLTEVGSPFECVGRC